MRIRFKSRLFPPLLTAQLAAQLAMLIALPALAADTNPPHRIIEHVTLSSGFELDCIRHEAISVADQQPATQRVRLYLSAGNYIDVPATQIAHIETQTEPIQVTETTPQPTPDVSPTKAPFTQEYLHPLLAQAGNAHNIDSDLLWSIVKAESDGNPRAVSRVGAQGLMQLMPATASTLGVANSFAPDENIAGGAAYLDMLLTRYHDNMALALAAYNAGPEAVDRYHGIPPYRETKLYVARVIREFNKRKATAARHESANATPPQPSAVKVNN